jgi:hypothetical protein
MVIKKRKPAQFVENVLKKSDETIVHNEHPMFMMPLCNEVRICEKILANACRLQGNKKPGQERWLS